MSKRQIVLWILGCLCLILVGVQLIPWEDVRAFTSGVVIGKSTTNAAMIYPFQRKSFHTGQTWAVGSFRASRDFLAVTYEDEAFWALDSAGTAFTTVDGETWEEKISENLPDFPGVAFGKGKYVAVGEQGKVFVSLDGTHWQERSSGVTSDLLGVAFGNGRFVAVGRGGVILSSLDGATWEVKDSGVSNDLHGVAFGSGRFVAVGQGGVVLTLSESGWYFVFYSDGRNMVYQSSRNGVGWNTPIAIRACTSGEQFSAGFDGVLVHYAYASGTPGLPLYYRSGTLKADGTISWVSGEQAAIPGNPKATYSIPSICADRDGFPWIGYRKAEGTNKFPMAVKGNRADGIWATAAGFPYALVGWTAAAWVASPVPLSSGKMLFLYTSPGHYIMAKRWDGKAWSPEVKTSRAVASVCFSAMAQGDDVHLAFLETSAIRYTKYASTLQRFISDEMVQSGLTQTSVPVLSMDLHDNLYLFWAGAPEANHIYLKVMPGGGKWDITPSEWVDESKEKLSGNDALAGLGRGEVGPALFHLTKGVGSNNLKFYFWSSSPPPPPALSIQITSPQDGETFPISPIVVTGTVSHEAEVTVNGAKASISGTTFSILVALLEGENAITVEVQDAYGQAVTKSRKVFRVTPPPVTILASAGPGGKIGPSGEVKVNYGANQEFIITPDSGYRIADVKVDGGSQGAIDRYPFTNVIAKHSIEALFIPEQAQKVIFAVNCGGVKYVGKDGTIFQADTAFSGGSTYKTTAAIEDTFDDVLYQSERYGSFSYRIPVAAGDYRVTLKLAEIYPYATKGSRLFGVKIEGQEVISHLDIYDRVGKNRAYDIDVVVLVTDGVLNIDFRLEKGGAKVNAILVVEEKVAPTVEMTANPRRIAGGGSATLTWKSTRASRAHIEPGIGEVPVNGSISISPQEDTTYTITVEGPGGSAEAEARVWVGDDREKMIITTVAGTGEYGNDGDWGLATRARIMGPRGLAVDALGDIYIVDEWAQVVRRVNPDGTIQTTAGCGYLGYGGDGGLAGQAQFYFPSGIAVDAEWNRYIADRNNNRVCKVGRDGIIRTIAGNGDPDSDGDGASAVEAGVYSPYAVAIDGEGNLLIAQGGRVRKVDGKGIITTLAGGGSGGDGGPAVGARLDSPEGIAVDSEGNLYIAETWGNRVRKVDKRGIITTVAGNGIRGYVGDDGPAVKAYLDHPTGVAVDEWGNLYIADRYNYRVRRVDRDGFIQTIAGGKWGEDIGDQGPAIRAVLRSPLGVAVDALGNLFIADSENHRVRKVEKVFKPTKGVVRGTVWDSTTGFPLYDVIVTVTDSAQKIFTTKTYGNGFGLSGLAPGGFTIRLEKPGYDPITKTGEAAVGTVTALDVRLDAIPPLEMKIEAPVDGSIVNSAAMGVTGRVSKPAAVRVNGTAAAVNAGIFSAALWLVEGSNQILAEAISDLGESASDRITVTLVVRGTLWGKVTDGSTNLPVSQASVSVTDAMNATRTVQTDSSGSYTIPGVYSGRFNGEIRKEGYAPLSYAGIMGPGQTMAQDGLLSRILPKISNIQVSNIATDSATITWETDQPTDGQIEYGLSDSYGNRAYDPTMAILHSITLTNLSPNTAYHFKVTATNQYGFFSSSEDGTFKTLRLPIELTIMHPKAGETIYSKDSMVMGVVKNPLGIETGVAVNGVVAMVGGHWYLGGQYFVANHVPLVEGRNVIEVMAVDTEGGANKISLEVNRVLKEDYVRITGDHEAGVAPLEVILQADSSLDLKKAEITGQAWSEFEFWAESEREYKARLFEPGLYIFAIKVQDAEGLLYEDKFGVIVLSKEAMDSSFKRKWEEMRGALLQGNIEKALDSFAPFSQERYRNILRSMGPERMQAVFGEIVDLEVEVVYDRVVYCGAIRNERGGRFSYPVTFILDENGIWKIKSF